jgi:hypothetical protein
MVIAEADLQSEWKKLNFLLENTRIYGATATSPKAYSTVQSEFEALLPTNSRIARLSTAVLTARNALLSVFNIAEASTQDLVLEYAKIIGVAVDASFKLAWSELFRRFVDNDLAVLSRGFVFGTPTAGASNVGTGGSAGINRLNVDAFGVTIENQWADAKLLRCTRDQLLGAPKHEEIFEIRSGDRGRDVFDEVGAGLVSELKALSAAGSSAFGVRNASFSTLDLTNGSLGDWSSSITINTTNYGELTGTTAGSGVYRDFAGDTTPKALRFKNAGVVYQNLYTNGGAFDSRFPVYFHVAVRRHLNATGTLVLRLTNAAASATYTSGGVSASVDLSTLTNDAWSLLKIGITITSSGPSTDNWYKNFAKDGLVLSIQALLSTGNVDVDDVTVGYFQQHDGSWYAIVGGETPWRVEDKFTWTDAEYGGATVGQAVNQKWNWRSVGGYLRSRPAAPTAAPTAALAGAGAGNVDNGAHTYFVAWEDVNGISSGLSAGSTPLTVVDKTTDGKVTVTRPSLPTENTHLAYWWVFRSTAGTTTPGKLVPAARIAKATTTYQDNTADSGLGANGNAGITMAEPS